MRASAGRAPVFCFPYAGGNSAIFQPWIEAAPDAIAPCAIELPGRVGRFFDDPFDNANDAANVLACDIAAHLDTAVEPRPFALFGHSMGGVLAFEVAARLEQDGRSPALICLSATLPPISRHRTQSSRSTPFYHVMTDDELANAFANHGSPVANVLLDTEARELLLPILRTDCRIFETYQPSRSRVECPILEIQGASDPILAEQERFGESSSWAPFTTGGHTLMEVSGGHYFVHVSYPSILNAIGERLAPKGKV